MKLNFIKLVKKKRHIDNLYLASIQKTGSQWIKTIFNDPRIINYTNLKMYPQHNYDSNEFHTTFPRGTFIPGLYIPYQLYQNDIKKPENYKTVYTLRDPRNLIISWYYSVLKSHKETPQILPVRKKLQSLSLEQGIEYSIKYLSYKLINFHSWVDLGSIDENVIFIKFEDITTKPYQYFSTIFTFMNIQIPDDELKTILLDYSKEKMREKEKMRNNKHKEFHYRTQVTDYKSVFTEQHYEIFENTYGNILEKLNYV